MADILDLAEIGATVPIVGRDGKTRELDVPGLSAHGIVYLAKRFPEIGKRILNGEAEATASVGFEDFLDLGLEFAVAFLAAGCGRAGNAQAEAVIAGLDITSQIAIFDAVVARTAPEGLRPFVERAEALLPSLGGVLEAARVASAQASAKRSPEPSTSSSAEDTASPISGA